MGYNLNRVKLDPESPSYISYCDGSHFGVKAGRSDNMYWQGRIDGVSVYAHILVMQLLGSYEGGMQVDHMDCNGLNNTQSNLRMASALQNIYNRAGWSSKSLPKGVFLNKNAKHKPYRVGIRVLGSLKSFGSYEDIELAELVSQEVRCKYHGEFARH